jgi:ABC-type phosphate transport system substrate-binding protein
MNDASRTSRRRILLGLAAGGLALATKQARAQSHDGAVILISARNPTQSLSYADVQKLFLGQNAFWHGVVPVKVLLRPDTSPAAISFYDPILKMSVQAFRKYWDELQLAGRGVTPRTIGGVEELAKTITQTPGAIGWALSSEAWKIDGVKLLQVK